MVLIVLEKGWEWSTVADVGEKIGDHDKQQKQEEQEEDLVEMICFCFCCQPCLLLM